MDTSLRDGLVRTRLTNNVERGWQTASTSFNIRKNKRNVEWLLKQSLNAFKLIQHRFNFHSTCFNKVEWGRRDGSTKIERMLFPVRLPRP